MTSRAALVLGGVIMVSLAWVFFQLWILYDRLGDPLLVVYFVLTVVALVAGIVFLVLAVLRRRRIPGV